MIPKDHLLCRIDVFLTSALGDLHEQLGAFYSAISRPSIDPELLVRMPASYLRACGHGCNGHGPHQGRRVCR
jgi:hypothetical protein